MYVWTAYANMVLPMGEAGIKEILNEPAVLSAMRSSLGDSSGLYLFPGLGLRAAVHRRVREGTDRMLSFTSRLGFTVVAGVLAAIGTNVSYWNWYGFPLAVLRRTSRRRPWDSCAWGWWQPPRLNQ